MIQKGSFVKRTKLESILLGVAFGGTMPDTAGVVRTKVTEETKHVIVMWTDPLYFPIAWYQSSECIDELEEVDSPNYVPV